MTLYRWLPEPVLTRIKAAYETRKAALREDAAQQNLVVAARAISETGLNNVESLADWRSKRSEIRRQLAWMLGLELLPELTPLNARITGVYEKTSYRIEKLVFESSPGLLVTANFYVPSSTTGAVPCVVYLNGHWPSLYGAKTGFQDRYLWYPANGFALLVIDPLGFGEVPGIHHGTSRLNLWEWVSLGYTPAGVEVWNGMRALDWLATRPEVDMSRVGVTGISGGGVMTQYLAALESRVAVAAPSCSTYTIGTQVAHGLVQEQCDCTFFPNVFSLDFPAVLALIAPRPLMLFGGRRDRIFPPEGFRAAYRQAKAIYRLFETQGIDSERIRLVESPEGHVDPPKFLRSCQEWMVRWLSGDEGSIGSQAETKTAEAEMPETLVCLNELPECALNFSAHTSWIRTADWLEIPSSEAWARRKVEVLGVLRERVFPWFPQGQLPFNTKKLRNSGGYVGQLVRFGDYEIDVETGVAVRVCVMMPKDLPPTAPLMLWIRQPTDQVGFPDIDPIIPLIPTTNIVVVAPRFADRLLPPADFARIERCASLVGRTVAGMQVWDVLRTGSWAREFLDLRPSTVEVFGRGVAGVVGAYAAVLDETISHVILENPPKSHRQGPALLTVLRTTDIPEVLALVAPRSVSIVGDVPNEFFHTRKLFSLNGAGESFRLSRSLTEAVIAGRHLSETAFECSEAEERGID